MKFLGSAGFRTNEALCQLSYEAPYLGPEGGKPDGPTQAGRQTYFKFKITPHKQKFIAKFFWQKDGPPDQWGHVLKYT